jgi:hypothetical protein
LIAGLEGHRKRREFLFFEGPAGVFYPKALDVPQVALSGTLRKELRKTPAAHPEFRRRLIDGPGKKKVLPEAGDKTPNPGPGIRKGKRASTGGGGIQKPGKESRCQAASQESIARFAFGFLCGQRRDFLKNLQRSAGLDRIHHRVNSTARGDYRRERKSAPDAEDIDQQRFARFIEQPVQSIWEDRKDLSGRKRMGFEAASGFRLNDSAPAQGCHDLQEGMPRPTHAEIQGMQAFQKAKPVLIKLRNQRMPGGFQSITGHRELSPYSGHGEPL